MLKDVSEQSGWQSQRAVPKSVIALLMQSWSFESSILFIFILAEK
jgi:hypothetical protein